MSVIAPPTVRSRPGRLPFQRSLATLPLRAWLGHRLASCRQPVTRGTAADERARILRDLHDGCGGHLLAALRLAQDGSQPERVVEALRDCIDDLRITLDGLDGGSRELGPLLAGQRDRMEARLAGSALGLEWCLDMAQPLIVNAEDDGLHVLRIVQEAFTNVLKHARARTLRVEGEVVEAQVRLLRLRIRDDGVGLGMIPRGRGLGNMQRRARLLGGSLELRGLAAHEGGGTEVMLDVPLMSA